MGELSRRTFIASGAAAAAGAAIAAAPKIAGDKAAGGTAEAAGQVTEPTVPAPREPVMAYVRDAQRGEVTVMAGTQETTYRDPVLVKRLLNAAPAAGSPSLEGDTNVLAP